jgi:RHS repeat-associated protein
LTASEPIEEEAADENAVATRGTHLASTQTVTHEYLTQSGKVMRETVTTNQTVTAVMDFVYDESGKPFAMIDQLSAQPKTYYYVLNLQGDVVKLIDQDGAVAAAYAYDAWGNILSQSGNMAEKNPLRYRGYYYDSETGFYYLQSRYYDPATRRFINADSYASTGQGFVGTNMFAYCNNNPAIFVDNGGTVGEEAAGWWASTMWWLCGIDGFLPIGDIVYGAGLVVCAFVIVDGVEETADNLIERFPSEEKEASDNITSYREHTTTKNGKKRNKHEEGNARRKRDQGGEKKKQKPGWTSRNNKWPIMEEK